MDQQPVVSRVLPDADALADAVAEALCERVAAAQAAGRGPDVALTGGTIAATMHRALARVGPTSDVAWERVHLWWGDERFVPEQSEERNARDVVPLLVALGVPPAHIHTAPAAVRDTTVTEAAAAYGEELRQHGSGEFELVLLGIGPDGHVASLFPHSAEVAAVDAITFGVTDSPKPPAQRVTLSLEALNRSRAVWFMASGAGKAAAVAAAHRPGPVSEIPARGVRGRVETVWWLDRAAAGH